jgi:Reverse transcriptase (RNA-dependent DNA polymerase)
MTRHHHTKKLLEVYHKDPFLAQSCSIVVYDLCCELKSIPGVEVVLYADDLAIIVTGLSLAEMKVTMNKAVQVLLAWIERNEIALNEDKTFYQIFTNLQDNYKPMIPLVNGFMKETLEMKYLGFSLDKKLTFKNHANQVAENGRKKMKILKRVTGSNWGTSQDTLINAYKIYILPVLTFGHELLITSSDNVTKQLDIVQNQALRIITGGVKTTPITAMELVTGIEPLWVQREKSSMKMFERIQRTPNSLWSNYIPTAQRLKKNSFMNQLALIYDKHNLPRPVKPKKFLFPNMSQFRFRPDVNLKLKNMKMRKGSLQPLGAESIFH